VIRFTFASHAPQRRSSSAVAELQAGRLHRSHRVMIVPGLSPPDPACGVGSLLGLIVLFFDAGSGQKATPTATRIHDVR
jgi:hypothetical protein